MDYVGSYRADLREMEEELRQAKAGVDPNDAEAMEELEFAQAMLLTLTPMVLQVNANASWRLETRGEGAVYGAYGVAGDVLSFEVRGNEGQGPVTLMMQPPPQTYQFNKGPDRLVSVGNPLGEVVWLKVD